MIRNTAEEVLMKSNLSPQDTLRIVGKALESFMRDISPNGFVVKDTESKKDYIVLINPMGEMIIDEAIEIPDEDDCTIKEVFCLSPMCSTVH
jgi:hypothetical protein